MDKVLTLQQCDISGESHGDIHIIMSKLESYSIATNASGTFVGSKIVMVSGREYIVREQVREINDVLLSKNLLP